MSQCDKLSLVILFFIYHPSLQVKAANTHSREESSGDQSFTVSLFTNTHSDREQRQGEGRAVNTGISGGHLHTCECLNRSALDTGGAQRTIQLCKHAATSFPQLLQACTETSHCLNSTHSIPVPGTRPAAASSLQACLPACLPVCLSRDRYRPYNSKGHPQQTKGFYRHAKLDSSTRNAPEPCAGYLTADCQSPHWPPTEERLAIERTKIITSLQDPCWNLNHLTPPVMTKLENYLYWYFKYAKCGGQ